MLERIDIAHVTAAEIVTVLASERPVLLEGLTPSARAATLLGSRELIDAVQRRADTEAAPYVRHLATWLDIAPELLDREPEIVTLYEKLLTLIPSQGVHMRSTHLRLWGSQRGSITPWHYDGNGVHGFNLHVTGQKYWQLVSPRTPLPALPCSHYHYQGANPLTADQRATLDWIEVVCGPGDVLFVPRLWSHYVVSLDAWNANLNVVFSPTSRPPSSPGTARERRRLAAAEALRSSQLWRVTPSGLKNLLRDTEDYGGDASHALRREAHELSLVERAGCVWSELRTLAPVVALWRYRGLLGLELPRARPPVR